MGKIGPTPMELNSSEYSRSYLFCPQLFDENGHYQGLSRVSIDRKWMVVVIGGQHHVSQKDFGFGSA